MAGYLRNRYAGDWIVNNGRRGVLYIGVVHLTAGDQRYAENHVHMGLHASFRLVGEHYSMMQLEAFDAKVEKYVDGRATGSTLERHPFASIGVSPLNNAVDFGVPMKDAAFWLRLIQPLLPYDALVVQYGAPGTAA
jgi:hypothetical protein